MKRDETKYSQKTQSFAVKFFFISIGLVIVLIAGFSIFGEKDKVEVETTEVVQNSPFDASVAQVEIYLKKNLNDPDSYEGIEWSEVQKIDGLPQHKYIVRHKYRAKNALGGYVVANQRFNLDSLGNVVSVTDWE